MRQVSDGKEGVGVFDSLSSTPDFEHLAEESYCLVLGLFIVGAAEEVGQVVGRDQGIGVPLP